MHRFQVLMVSRITAVTWLLLIERGFTLHRSTFGIIGATDKVKDLTGVSAKVIAPNADLVRILALNLRMAKGARAITLDDTAAAASDATRYFKLHKNIKISSHNHSQKLLLYKQLPSDLGGF